MSRKIYWKDRGLPHRTQRVMTGSCVQALTRNPALQAFSSFLLVPLLVSVSSSALIANQLPWVSRPTGGKQVCSSPHSQAHSLSRKALLHSTHCFFFCLFRATPAAYGGSQARGLIQAVATGLHYSHSNARSKPHLQPTPQLSAVPDP